MLGGAVVASCAHPVMLLHGRDVVITGRNTAQATPDAATRIVMAEATQITLDHGYRYFEIQGAIRPGAKTPIRLYATGEHIPSTPNVFDASQLMLNEPQPKEASPEEDMIEH
jgi:hypothetical protein